MSETTIDVAPSGAIPPPVPPIVPPAAPVAAVPPVVPPAVASDAEGAEIKIGSKALKARLDEERAKGEKSAAESFAKELGIPLADAKKLIAEQRAKDEASKSEVRRLTEEKAARDEQLKEFAAYKQAVEARAALELSSLNDAQRAAVLAIAKDSPALQLQTIDTLRPTWQAVAQAQAEAKAAADKAVAEAAAAAAAKAPAPGPAGVPAPVTTAPVAPPAPPPGPSTPTNHLATYEALKRENPYQAQAYFALHASTIIAARSQQAR